MEYVYSALLLHKAGKQISEENIRKVLEATGIKADDAKIKALVAALEGVDIEQAIKEAATMHAPAEKAKVEEKKEEKKKEDEVSEEKAAAGLGSLFG